MTRPAIHRIRLILEARTRLTLPADHGALLYAVLSEAFGRARGAQPELPDGILLDAPETCRVLVRARERYAFGLTLLSEEPGAAQHLLADLLEGLRRLGAEGAPRRQGFGGNIAVVAVEDLVRRAPYAAGTTPAALPRAALDDELRRAGTSTVLTLRFQSPLRMFRAASKRTEAQPFFDGQCFQPGVFLTRVGRRLAALGLCDPAVENEWVSDDAVELLENRLVWRDLPYGPPERRKRRLGGAVGLVRLRVVSARLRERLVLGQHVRAGESTRFGLGRYRIEELGEDPTAAAPAEPVLERARRGDHLGAVSERYGIASGELSAALARLADGSYSPSPHQRIRLRIPGHRDRELAIPTRLDRAVQSVVAQEIAPGLDRLFEESSFAYRRGLGRAQAAERIADAYRRGYRFALKSDFRRFFDEIDHATLTDRIEACFEDRRLVAALLAWVRIGAPTEGKGLPTGSPLSPLLSNLLLDQFDERMAADGACLVRYADDFLVLVRRPEEAERIEESAHREAEALRLQLHADKTRQLDLQEPFDFLGFHFERRGQWCLIVDGGRRRVEDLGWREARPSALAVGSVRLAGEVEEALVSTPDTVLVVGPGATTIKRVGDDLVIANRDGGPETTVAADRVHDVLVLGNPAFGSGAIKALLRRGVPTLLADDWGAGAGVVTSADTLEDAEVVTAQVAAAADPARRLVAARALVAAKLRNHAALADRFPPREAGPDVGASLRTLAERCGTGATVEEVMGIEGAGAAQWYGSFASRLPPKLTFHRRVAPAARDPVNILLNAGQTILHRLLTNALRQIGLAPSIGLLHRPRPGHAALASDAQEPFRHLVDRVVLELAPQLDLRSFTHDEDDDAPVHMGWPTSRELVSRLYRTLALPCLGVGRSEAVPYTSHAWALARSLRAHVLDPMSPLEVFTHP